MFMCVRVTYLKDFCVMLPVTVTLTTPLEHVHALLWIHNLVVVRCALAHHRFGLRGRLVHQKGIASRLQLAASTAPRSAAGARALLRAADGATLPASTRTAFISATDAPTAVACAQDTQDISVAALKQCNYLPFSVAQNGHPPMFCVCISSVVAYWNGTKALTSLHRRFFGGKRDKGEFLIAMAKKALLSVRG